MFAGQTCSHSETGSLISNDEALNTTKHEQESLSARIDRLLPIRSSKMPGHPHTCHHHLQNGIQWKRMLIRSAVDQQRFRCIRRADVQYDEFLGQIRHRSGLGSLAEAERATSATLEKLAERLAGGEARDLAAQLPASACTLSPTERAGNRDQIDPAGIFRGGESARGCRPARGDVARPRRHRGPHGSGLRGARYKTFVSSSRLRSLSSFTSHMRAICPRSGRRGMSTARRGEEDREGDRTNE